MQPAPDAISVVSLHDLVQAAKALFAQGHTTADMPEALLRDQGWTMTEAHIANALAWDRDNNPPRGKT